MAIYKVEDNQFKELEHTKLETEKIYEVKDLQTYLANSIQIIGDDLLVIATEFSNWEDSKRSIDILCIDKDANLVVIEIKRSNEGHMELQAIRYAAMIANMTFDRAISTFQTYLEKHSKELDAKKELLTFLEWTEIDEDDFAKDVKIILVAANFSIEITTSILWLNERDLDIKCVKLNLQKDKGNIYYDIQQLIPLPQSADYLVRLKEKVAEERAQKRKNRKESVIAQLFNTEKLAIGQRVVFKPLQDAYPEIQNKDVSASIVKIGTNCLKMDDEEQLYSFSKLRKFLIDKYSLSGLNPDWGFNLQHEWINEQGLTLAELLKK